MTHWTLAGYLFWLGVFWMLLYLERNGKLGPACWQIWEAEARERDERA